MWVVKMTVNERINNLINDIQELASRLDTEKYILLLNVELYRELHKRATKFVSIFEYSRMFGFKMIEDYNQTQDWMLMSSRVEPFLDVWSDWDEWDDDE